MFDIQFYPIDLLPIGYLTNLEINILFDVTNSLNEIYGYDEMFE